MAWPKKSNWRGALQSAYETALEKLYGINVKSNNRKRKSVVMDKEIL